MKELTSKTLIKAIASTFKEEENKDIEQAVVIQEHGFTYLKFPDDTMFCVTIYYTTVNDIKNEQP